MTPTVGSLNLTTSAPLPVGTVIPWAGGWPDAVPSGWLYCVGDPCPDEASELEQLLTLSGSPFGQSGGRSLLPNLGGQFVRGVQMNTSSGGYDPDFASRTPAPGVGSAQGQTILSHTHTYSHFPDSQGPAGSSFWDNNATDGGATSDNAGGDMHPAYVSLIHLIKGRSDADDAPMRAGTIVMYVGDQKRVEDLIGWHECDGKQFSAAQWPDLLKVLPHGYYPNLLGVFVRGADLDPGPRRDPDQALRFRIEVNGDKTTQVPDSGVLSMQESALQTHEHGVHVVTEDSGGYGILAAHGWTQGDQSTTAFPDPKSEDGKETRPANVALPYIICQGVEGSQS